MNDGSRGIMVIHVMNGAASQVYPLFALNGTVMSGEVGSGFTATSIGLMAPDAVKISGRSELEINIFFARVRKDLLQSTRGCGK